MDCDWSNEDVEAAWRQLGGFRADSLEGSRRIMTAAVALAGGRVAAAAQGAEDYKALADGLEALVGGPGLAPVIALKRRVERARRSEEAWRKRLEAAAEELADVGAGELGRLDVAGRVRLLKRRMGMAEAELARIAPLAHERDRLRAGLKVSVERNGTLERTALRADREAAELRGKVQSVCRTMEQQVREVEKRYLDAPRLPPPGLMLPEERAWRTMVGAMRAHCDFLHEALSEKSAEPTTPLSEAVKEARGAVERLEEVVSLRQPFAVGGAHKPGTNSEDHDIYMCHVENCPDCKRVIAASSRYPCSPTCTHDDAATPGHAERVKATSEALAGALGGVIATRREATSDEQSAYALGREEGAEAMRAAILEAVLRYLERCGLSPSLADALKAVIEGAEP